MRMLLIESSPGVATEVAGTLDAAGHEVLRCHAPDAPTFPCSGLTHEGCPLDGVGPVDVAITVHDEESGADPTAREAGATCAVRTGLPLVVVAADGVQPFGEHAELAVSPLGVPAAVDRAVAAASERRAGPIRAEVERLLAAEGVDAGEVHVQVTRDGETARIVVWTEQPLSEALANTVATRAHAVDRQGSWPTSKTGVAVGTIA